LAVDIIVAGTAIEGLGRVGSVVAAVERIGIERTLNRVDAAGDGVVPTLARSPDAVPWAVPVSRLTVTPSVALM
jgi:hypothetical protein